MLGFKVHEDVSNKICLLHRITTFARTELCNDKLKLATGIDISTVYLKYSKNSIQYWHNLLQRKSESLEIDSSNQNNAVESKLV